MAGALRNAVRDDKVSHAYLFSGPRGTGKTSSARILAKALNCTNLQDGEPCGDCDSCVQVVAGSSMDVIELDAASNNGVEAMRDLTARAALGTAGRRKVYIVDEVHMLSTAASNALLKTLEEPPDHVVFVLATTDPQKVLDTIISRTQHFAFRLASLDTLNDHLKSVAASAGIDLDDDTMLAVARRGNGSFRDALSVLDQVATLGHIDQSSGDLESVVSAVADRDAAAALASIGALIDQGRDPRQLVRDLVSLLRECFLSLLAPRLVGQGSDVSARFATNAADLGRRLGTPLTVRVIEVLGESGVAMRDSIDPRTTLEVALVKLVRPDLDTGASAIMARLDRLEAGHPSGSTGNVHAGLPESPPVAPSPVAPAPSGPPKLTVVPTNPQEAPDQNPPVATATAAARPAPPPATPPAAGGRSGPQGARAALAQSKGPQGSTRSSGDRPAPTTTPAGSAALAADGTNLGVTKDAFLAAIESRMTKAMFNAGRFLDITADSATFALPNDMTLNRCLDRLADVTPALQTVLGRTVALSLVVDQGGAPEPTDPGDASSEDGQARPQKTSPLREAMANPVTATAARVVADEHDVDINDLSDAPAVSAVDVIMSAFPGTEILEQE